MTGIFGNVAGSSADSSRSSADFLDQVTITSDDAAPEDRIANMMREMLDIPEYDNDVECFNVIQKKGGKDTRQSFGQHQGLLLQLTDPSKNPDKKMLKLDLLTIKQGDVPKQMERHKDESNILISEIIGHFLKLSIFYDEKIKQVELSIDNIQEILQNIDKYVEMMANESDNLSLMISRNKIIKRYSVIESCWSSRKHRSFRSQHSILTEIAKQQKKSIYKLFEYLTTENGLVSIDFQEINKYCNMKSIESMDIDFLPTERLFKIDEVKMNELVKRINKIGNEMAILSKQNERNLNQIGLSVQKENVVLKLSIVNENSEGGPKDGKILKQITIKKCIDDMAKILAGHYSDFGNYKLLTNDCRHYVQRVLEELELKQLSPCKTLLKHASILISSFRTGRAQDHQLKTLSDQLGMAKEYERIEFSNIGQKAEQLITMWFESKGRKIATINTLLTALKHDQVGLTAIAEEIEDSCLNIDIESVYPHTTSNQLYQETVNIQQSRSPITVLQNINVQGNVVINIQNLSTQLGIKPEDIPTFLKMLPPLGGKAEYLQKLIRLKHNEKFRLLPIHTMTRSTCLLHYNGPNGRHWHGSGFLVSLANFSGLLLLSAGHNIEDGGSLLQDFSNFSFLFNNISGIQATTVGATANNDVIPFNLQNLLNNYDCTLVITYKGMQLIQKGNGAPQQTTLQGNDAKLDYFALVFHAADIQDNLKKQGLEFLHCASASQLAPKKGDPVLIFGHPGVTECQCPSGTCSCTHPMRLSYGNETGSSVHRMAYDLDTLRGNSGSPITGRNYTVKGIHVTGGTCKGLLSAEKQVNIAQTLESVLKDLGKHSIIPVVTP